MGKKKGTRQNVKFWSRKKLIEEIRERNVENGGTMSM